jgi:hypothetical protein
MGGAELLLLACGAVGVRAVAGMRGVVTLAAGASCWVNRF